MWQPMPRKLTAPLRRKIEAKLRHCILFEFNENEIETVHAAGTRMRSSATLLHGGLFHQAKRQFDEVTATTICLGLRRPRDFNRVASATMAGWHQTDAGFADKRRPW
jgi:hypothetical protein